MRTAAIRDFAETDAGLEFRRLYDAVLTRWPDVVSRDVATRFGTTRVNASGAADGRPVVLLPGAGATSTVFASIAAELGRRHRVHAIDLMGDVGCSVPDVRRLASVDDLDDWLDDVLAALGLDSVDVVAHSYGAMIATGYALRRKGRVVRLLLLDPNALFSRMSARYLLRALPTLVRPTDERQRSFLHWETEGMALDTSWVDLNALGAQSFPTHRPVVPRRPSAARLRTLSADVTVILAGRSKVHDTEAVARAVPSYLPEARVVVLDRATHHSLPLFPADELAHVLNHALARNPH